MLEYRVFSRNQDTEWCARAYRDGKPVGRLVIGQKTPTEALRLASFNAKAADNADA